MGNVLKALAAIKEIFDLAKNLFKLVQEWRKQNNKKNLEKSVEQSFKTKDQRSFEKAMGSTNAGKPTKHRLHTIKSRPAKDRSNNNSDVSSSS